MDLLSFGSAWLRDKLKAHASSDVILQRSTTIIPNVPATRGSSTWEGQASDGDGTVLQIKLVDWIIDFALLPWGLPEEGDLVIAKGKVYEALPINNGLCYRFVDPAETIIRIHTKPVARTRPR